MPKRALKFVSLLVVLMSLSGVLYSNCAPIGETFGEQQNNSSEPPRVELPDDPNQFTKGQDYWTNTLEPLLQTSCNACHALPFQGGDINAGLRIYNYAEMRALVQQGPSVSDNPFFNRPAGKIDHTGGNRCNGDETGQASPCREIREWALLEFPLLADGVTGEVLKTDLLGRINGWVLDATNPSVPINILLYLDASADQGGTLVGNVLANGQGIGADKNGHYYNVQLPLNFRDGQVRNLYAYGDTAVADNLLPGMPVQTQGFEPKNVGDPARNIYENELRPQLNQCMACHQVTYDVHWFQVGNPTPLDGGLPNDNELINHMNGENNHSGGSFCGGNKNNEPCASVQRWWQAEFGN